MNLATEILKAKASPRVETDPEFRLIISMAEAMLEFFAQGASAKNLEKVKKPQTRLRDSSFIIHEYLANGKIWAIQELYEEAKKKYPLVNLRGINNRANALAKKGEIVKISTCVYRKKENSEEI